MMAHTEVMPQSRMSLDGHTKLIGEVTALPQDEFERRKREVTNYFEAGTELDITGWQQRAGRLLTHFTFEGDARRNDSPFTPNEIAETLKRYGL